MIAPLLWLLLAAAAVTEPHLAQWHGAAPVVVTRPSQPTSGGRVIVGIADLPPQARKVVAAADGDTASATRASTGVYRAVLRAGTAGPLTIVVRFTVNGVRYEVPGAVILVAPAG